MFCQFRTVLTFACFVFAAVAQTSNPVVRTAQGLASGSWKTSTNGRTYASFTGVPYARPPVGKYRFREPQLLKSWPGVWDASRHAPTCLQYDPFNRKIQGSENCLFVNVYSPNVNAGASLPVMVFIHGGAFMYGGSDVYDPVHIMDRDMVAVTLNYRLGPLGFLSTGDEVIPGNAGLKDQSMALHWVKNNIMMFGGNPDSVTLTGCSAGGASVHYHYLSPKSKDTFARGISFSGSAFSSWTHQLRPAQKAKTLASMVGCSTATSRDIAECLRFRTAESVVQAQIDMFEWKVHKFTPFTPTIEAAGVRDPFLTQYPFFMAQAGQMHKVPLIASVCSEEGLYPAAAYQKDPPILPELESRWEHLASHIFEYNDTLPLALRPEVARKIKQHYLAGKPVSQQTFQQLVQALGDRLFNVDVGKLAQIHAKKSGQPVYMYRYAFRGDISLTKLMSQNNENYGVSHADDLFHIWAFPGVSDDMSKEDFRMINSLVDFLYAYSTTGVPNFADANWSPVVAGSPEVNYLEITAPGEAEMKTSSDFGHKSFWDSLGLIENERFNYHVKDEL